MSGTTRNQPRLKLRAMHAKPLVDGYQYLHATSNSSLEVSRCNASNGVVAERALLPAAGRSPTGSSLPPPGSLHVLLSLAVWQPIAISRHGIGGHSLRRP